ncbi:DUF2799 domain-containing protein [Crenobacter sp. SG2303]|uniref:DUF2799 domain-containing protein n=1 Tax=Crenobacter oryzisoli TaxID=3056844 RepID=A0ABT7XMA0_9NEIS|nr:DUF2799 domain-containing protein [Crenobacter sp. SG2303]MDN0074914.1 DUF2799 domain-containing protein [Crenobacter sp. SG2303]
MRFLPLFLSLLLSGCATLNEQQCRTLSSAAIGETDGRAGYPTTRFDDNQQACGKYQLTLDRDAYLTGRARGLQDYCTPDNGTRVGLRGERYYGVCPKEREDAFLLKYWPAYVQFQRESYYGSYWAWPYRYWGYPPYWR